MFWKEFHSLSYQKFDKNSENFGKFQENQKKNPRNLKKIVLRRSSVLQDFHGKRQLINFWKFQENKKKKIREILRKLS